MSKAQVLIIDDFLLTPLAAEEHTDILEIVEDRHLAGSTLITSQCPLKHWHEGIGDPALADALLDQLVHNTHNIGLKGPLMLGRDGD